VIYVSVVLVAVRRRVCARVVVRSERERRDAMARCISAEEGKELETLPLGCFPGSAVGVGMEVAVVVVIGGIGGLESDCCGCCCC